MNPDQEKAALVAVERAVRDALNAGIPESHLQTAVQREVDDWYEDRYHADYAESGS